MLALLEYSRAKYMLQEAELRFNIATQSEIEFLRLKRIEDKHKENLDPIINPKEFQASLAWVKFDLKL